MSHVSMAPGGNAELGEVSTHAPVKEPSTASTTEVTPESLRRVGSTVGRTSAVKGEYLTSQANN
jgi:hypothetical protein